MMKRQLPFFSAINAQFNVLENTAKAILFNHGFDDRSKIRFVHKAHCCSTIIYIDKPDQIDAHRRLALKRKLSQLGSQHHISLNLSYVPLDISEAASPRPSPSPNN